MISDESINYPSHQARAQRKLWEHALPAQSEADVYSESHHVRHAAETKPYGNPVHVDSNLATDEANIAVVVPLNVHRHDA